MAFGALQDIMVYNVDDEEKVEKELKEVVSDAETVFIYVVRR